MGCSLFRGYIAENTLSIIVVEVRPLSLANHFHVQLIENPPRVVTRGQDRHSITVGCLGHQQRLLNEVSGEATATVIGQSSQSEHVVDFGHLRVTLKDVSTVHYLVK